MKRILTYLLLITLTHLSVNAQTETYAEKLGFPKGKKVYSVIYMVSELTTP